MKVIEKTKINRNDIKNIKKLEEVAGVTVNYFDLIKIDLENGRIAEIISHLNYQKDMIIVSIREIGILTRKVFLQKIIYMYEGKEGLEVVSNDFTDVKEIYNKYKIVLDELAMEKFNKEGYYEKITN